MNWLRVESSSVVIVSVQTEVLNMKFHLESNVQYTHTHTQYIGIFTFHVQYLNNLSACACKSALAYMLYKTSIRHFSDTQFYHHD
jgi:hypothetical protein